MHNRNRNICLKLTTLLFFSSLLTLGAAPASNPKSTLPKALSDGLHPKNPELQLVSNVAFPSFPQKMRVYRREDSAVTLQSATNFIAGLLRQISQIKAKRTIFLANGMLGDAPFRIEVERATGSFTLENQELYNPEVPTIATGEFPNMEESKKIATDFLQKHKLLPDDAYLRGVVDNIQGAAVMSVGFGRRVNGLECWGAGAEILVDIGRGGSIARIRKAWPTLTPADEHNLMKPETAIQKLKDGEGVIYHGQKGKVVGIKLVYYASPIAQEYLQPCYFVDCQEIESGEKFYGVIEAVQTE